MVKDLEQAFATTLVERSVRGVALSPAGRMALQRTRAGLALVDHLAHELQADRPMVLRIGTNPALTSKLLPHALKRLDAGRAPLRFALRTGIVGDMMAALGKGELDGYVGRVDWDQVAPDMTAMLRHTPLTRTDLVLACPVTHALAGRDDVSIQDLLRWPWALPPADSHNRIALETSFRNHGLKPPVPAIEIAVDPLALMRLAREIGLLTCVPRLALDPYVEAGELCALEVPDLRLAPIHIGLLAFADDSELPPLKALRQALLEALKHEEGGGRR